MSKNPLGRDTDYPQEYSPDLLFPVPRSEARQTIGIGSELPFTGHDLWNAWELTWLDERGKPIVATAEFRLDARSENLIESKSFKLYLNSLAMTRYPDAETVANILFDDLSRAAGGDVEIDLYAAGTWNDMQVDTLPGTCIDDLDVECTATDVDKSLLIVDESTVANEQVYSHLLRSNCPVTNQPDSGSVYIEYSGKQIDHEGLLAYLVSYRQHEGFHEACVENIFVDIMERCAPDELTVLARYNRRGGLDINPIRSTEDVDVPNLRLWRQ